MDISEDLKRNFRFKVLENDIEFCTDDNRSSGWYVIWKYRGESHYPDLREEYINIYIIKQDIDITIKVILYCEGIILYLIDSDFDHILEPLSKKMNKYINDTIKDKTLDEFVSVFRVLIDAIERFNEMLNNFEIVKSYKRVL